MINVSPFAISSGTGVSAAGTNIFTGSNTFTDTFTVNETAQAGVAETIATFKVSDSASAFYVENQSVTDGAFISQIRGAIATASTSLALNVVGEAGLDSGATACVQIVGRLGTAGNLTTRPILSVLNNASQRMILGVNGTLTLIGSANSLIAGGATIGAAGTALTQIRNYSQALTPASVAAGTTAEQTFTVTGLTTADKVVVNGPAMTAGTGIVNFRVSAADTLAISFSNNTAGALTPASGTYTVVAVRS